MVAKSKEEKAADREAEKKEDAAIHRQSPDKPAGIAGRQPEEDFYQKQRDESPDGMTARERDQWQKGAPGSLDQKTPDGESLGESVDEANPVGGQEQSGGR